jgi:hypothetical protein
MGGMMGRVSAEAMTHALATLYEEHNMELCYNDDDGDPVDTFLGASLLAYFVNHWYAVTDISIDPMLADQAHSSFWE